MYPGSAFLRSDGNAFIKRFRFDSYEIPWANRLFRTVSRLESGSPGLVLSGYSLDPLRPRFQFSAVEICTVKNVLIDEVYWISNILDALTCRTISNAADRTTVFHRIRFSVFHMNLSQVNWSLRLSAFMFNLRGWSENSEHTL